MSPPVVVVKLKHPVRLGEKDTPTEELQFRRPRFGDLMGLRIPEKISDVAIGDMLTFAARLAGQHMEVMERIEEEDIGAVLQVAVDFFAGCLPTGKTQ